MDGKEFKKIFLEQMSREDILKLFDYMQDIYFWIKDKNGRFVAQNHAAIINKPGCTSEMDILGKTTKDFYPPGMSEAFTKDDIVVMKSDTPQFGKMELRANEDGSIGWFNSTKIPVHNHNGNVIGTIGFARDLNLSSDHTKVFNEMSPVIKFIQNNYQTRIEIATLAKMACLSVSQFERKFKQYFSVTPLKFIISLRIKFASRQLIKTNLSIARIAENAGFYNSGSFTTKFIQMLKMSPSEYRKKYNRKGLI